MNIEFVTGFFSSLACYLHFELGTKVPPSVYPLLFCHGPCTHIFCSLGSMLRWERGSLISQLKQVTTKYSFGQFDPVVVALFYICV